MNYHFTNFCIEISTLRQVEAFNFPKIKLSSFENNIEKIKVEKVLYLNENVRDQDGYQDFQDPNRCKRSNRIVVIMYSLSRKNSICNEWIMPSIYHQSVSHFITNWTSFHCQMWKSITLECIRNMKNYHCPDLQKINWSYKSNCAYRLLHICALFPIYPFAIRIFVAQNRSMSIEDPVVPQAHATRFEEWKKLVFFVQRKNWGRMNWWTKLK